MNLCRPLCRRGGSGTLAIVQTASLENRPRPWLLPRAAVVELSLAITRLAIVGLIAIGISGVAAGIFGSAFGRSFVAGDPPGVTNTAERCGEYFEYSPGATTCEEAATWHHYGEIVRYRVGAGVLGAILLAVYGLARRRRRRLRGDRAILPPGFEATIGTAMYAAAAAYLMGSSVDGAALHETAGIGGSLSGGIVASIIAIVYGISLYRVLLRRAEGGSDPGSADRA